MPFTVHAMEIMGTRRKTISVNWKRSQKYKNKVIQVPYYKTV